MSADFDFLNKVRFQQRIPVSTSASRPEQAVLYIYIILKTTTSHLCVFPDVQVLFLKNYLESERLPDVSCFSSFQRLHLFL